MSSDLDGTARPILLPDLGISGQAIHVSAWFVDVGDTIQQGDRVVELLIRGVTFDLPAPVAGRVTRIDKFLDAAVSEGDVLGWITPDAE